MKQPKDKPLKEKHITEEVPTLKEFFEIIDTPDTLPNSFILPFLSTRLKHLRGQEQEKKRAERSERKRRRRKAKKRRNRK